jgi:hypothetical protein
MIIGNTEVKAIKIGQLGAYKQAYENYAGAFGAGDPDEINRATRTLFDVCISNSGLDKAAANALFKELDADMLWQIIIAVPGEPVKSMIEAGAENLKNLPALMRQSK